LDFGQMGTGSAILVVASNLHEEAPIWYLRVKQAAERGATLIVANARHTRLDRYAAHTLRYAFGEQAKTIQGLFPGRGPANPELSAAAQALVNAGQVAILFGSDGLGLVDSQALAHACAELIANLRGSGDEGNQPTVGTIAASGKVKGALIGIWPHANDQGAWELGYQAKDYAGENAQTTRKALYVAAADPFGDEPEAGHLLAGGDPFIVVQELFLTATAQRADVVLPVQAFTERDGTFTTGERRVQRFYPAVPARPGCRPDYAITAEIGKHLGLDLESRSPAAVFAQISANIPAFNGLDYRRLAETTSQWPVTGTGLARKGLYFSGTEYENKQGLGVHLALSPHPQPLPKGGRGEASPLLPGEGQGVRDDGFLAVPVTCLYDRGLTVWTSELLRGRGGNRSGQPWGALNPADAARLGISQGQPVQLSIPGSDPAALAGMIAQCDESVPPGVILVPRSFGIPVHAPCAVTITTIPEKTEAE
jgi:NADH-quinone oxidoreductase subunit G